MFLGVCNGSKYKMVSSLINESYSRYPPQIILCNELYYIFLVSESCFEYDIDYTHNELKHDVRDSAIECQTFCRETDQCRFFTYDTQNKYCWLKTSKEGRRQDAYGCISGKKTCDQPG